MAKIILLNKPFHTLCQFVDKDGRDTLSKLIDRNMFPHFYPAGRLDYDSEGLVILTNNGAIQHQISHPEKKMAKSYWVQVEGEIEQAAIHSLCHGVQLKDGLTKPALAKRIDTPDIWKRVPPIRARKDIPTSWLQLTINEGRNRQVRRMTAAVGFPTLRLVRYQIGPWQIEGLSPGAYREQTLYLPSQKPVSRSAKRR